MLAGCTAMSVAWVAIAAAVLRPAGASVPLIWPGAAAALLLALLQVVAWLPLAQPWLRIVVALPIVLFVLAAIALKLAVSGLPDAVATGLLLLPLPCVSGGGGRVAWRAERLRLAAWRRLIERIAGGEASEHPFSSQILV
jgi:hypothetical protein